LHVFGLEAAFNRIFGPENLADRPGVTDVQHQDSADPAIPRDTTRTTARKRFICSPAFSGTPYGRSRNGKFAT
jgi:hypothetical protein